MLRRCQSHWSDKEKSGSDGIGGENEASKLPATPKSGITDLDSRSSNYDLDKYNFSSSKWKFDTVWLSKALESASQLCRWALPSGLFKMGLLLQYVKTHLLCVSCEMRFGNVV